MTDRIIIASHITFGGYGFWLPNDPRGSGSRQVRKLELRPFGEATFLAERKQSRARLPNDRKWQAAAKSVLAHPPAKFDEAQRLSIGAGFSKAVEEGGYQVFACAVLTDHVHLVVAAHERHPDLIERHVKSKATNRIRGDGLWPADHPVWQLKGWSRFIYDEEDLRNTIKYVYDNPRDAGLPDQLWDWGVQYM